MEYASDPDGYLSSWLATISQNYDQGFREYWALDAKEPPSGFDEKAWRMTQILNSLAEMFYRSTRELRQPPSAAGTGRADLVGLVEVFRQRGWDITEERFIRQRLELFYAEELEDELLRMTDRALELLPFLTEVRSDQVRSYLERVAACYLRGMVSEGAVMCRAVLDSAFQSYVSDETVRRCNPRARTTITLGPRIQTADQLGLLPKATVTKAYHVKKVGDDAVHSAPSSDVDLRGLLHELKDVIEALDAIPSGSAN